MFKDIVGSKKEGYNTCLRICVHVFNKFLLKFLFGFISGQRVVYDR